MSALIDNDPAVPILDAYIAKEELRWLLTGARNFVDDHKYALVLRFYYWCADAARRS
ncbi:hypothetical protein [Gordonia liuliyuniae]|uniref:Uncharacterized protein n=1 Tax=Gordonia liuliyuniae TaxID=2911517 RepID=A0ABS9IWC5_9ACTN|nr:hypothetical protein [Gordonia liuliyuniae]MCF8589851.1 hypothetical protein [Gordonia liuliyuniae]